MNKLIGYVADASSISDLLMDVFNVVNIRKQNKINRNLTIGTYIALSALAVGVSMYQTNSIKDTIKEYSGKKEHGVKKEVKIIH